MSEYKVQWEIDLEAETLEEAARKALEIQRDPESIATVFDVTDKDGKTSRIDLTFIRKILNVMYDPISPMLIPIIKPFPEKIPEKVEKNYAVHLLTSSVAQWEVKATSEQEAVDKILYQDPLFDDYAKHKDCDEVYRVVAVEIGEEEEEEEG